MEMIEDLRNIGLTGSEIKVYIALIKLGFASKSNILKESKIASSKIYIVLDKLLDKGLASTILKNNVKYYSAAPVSKIKDYINDKKIKLEKEEKLINKIIPNLLILQNSIKSETKVEVYVGWKGIETVYSYILSTLKKNDEALILGASFGSYYDKTKKFFEKYNFKANSKNILVKIIFNENSRKYSEEIELENKIKLNKKFLFKKTPIEFLITKQITAIIMLKEDPLIILIHDKETAESFNTYFQELWKISKV